MRALWLIGGLLSVALGAVGAFLPLLPTVPFMLLAAICFAKSSERLHNWLLTHPRFGPPIADWQDRGAIGRRAKWLATLSVAASFALTLAVGFGPSILAVQAVALIGVMVFVWTRPNA